MSNFWNIFKQKIYRAKDIGYFGSANILGTGISALFWFYLASILETEHFGEIHYFLGIAGIAYCVSLIGTSSTITVYTAKNVKIHSALYLITLVGGLTAFLVIFAIFQRLDIGFLVFGYIVYDLGIYYLLGKRFYSRFSKNVLIQKILTFIFGLSFYYLFGPNGIIYGLALSYIHLTIIVYRVFKESRIDFSLLKSRRDFIANNYFENMVNGLRQQADKIIIAPLLGYAVLGNYALAMQVLTVLVMPVEIVFKYILPQDASGLPNPKLKKIAFLVSIGIAAFGVTVLPLLIPYFFPKYTDATEAIQILSLNAVTSMIGFFYVSKLLSLEKSRFILIGRLISFAVIIAGMITLPKFFGISGAAMAFVLSSAAQTVFFIGAYRNTTSINRNSDL